jgi:hypothetical protein
MSVSEGADTPTPTYKITIDGDGVKVSREIDAETATEILAVVMGGGGTPAASTGGRRKKPARTDRSKPAASGGKRGAKATPKRKAGAPSIVRDLSMRPSGKKSFVDFVKEKQPKTHQQKQAVIVAWLRDQGGVSTGITVDHVNTCYVEADWRRPANLSNALSVTAKVKGWLDTANLSDIKLTTRGEDEVKHNLPPEPKK